MNFAAITFILSVLECLADAVTTQPPVITEQPLSTNVYFSSNGTNFIPFSLECAASGSLPMRYWWLKNGELFNWRDHRLRVQLYHEGSLHFFSPLPSDEGSYQCFVENFAGIAMTKIIRVQFALLDEFAPDIPPHVVFISEFDDAVLACHDPPFGIPKPSITWILENATSHQRRPLESRRQTVDENGNLHISTVLATDSFLNVLFMCGVSNVAGTRFGSRTMISVVTSRGNDFARPLIGHFVSPKWVTVVLGQTLELKCIYAGNPPPEVFWRKRGGVAEKARLSNDVVVSGATLRISAVTWQDEGVYVCNVTNGVGDGKSHTFSVKVVVPPKFVGLNSGNVNATSGSNVVLNCPVFGIPIPDVEWFINGSSTNVLSSDHFQTNFSSLWISDATIFDTGTYQCNASNAYGYDVTSMYLAVNDADSPQFISNPLHWYEGKWDLINCSDWADDVKSVEWLQNGNLVEPDERREILPNGTLSIYNISRFDEGSYVCVKKLVEGTTLRTTGRTYHVFNRTHFVRKPRDTDVPVGSHVTFPCMVKADARMKAVSDWMYENDFLNESDVQFTVAEDNALTLFNVSMKQTGKYTCVIDDGQVVLASSAIMFVKGKPATPGIVGVKCEKNVARIEWRAMSDVRNPITHFRLEYAAALDEFATWKDVDVMTAPRTSHEVSLIPGLEYIFRVIAVNDIGESEPSSPSGLCVAQPDVPYHHPDDVAAAVGTNGNKIIISWKPIPPSEHNGPGFYYRVYWLKVKEEFLWNMVDVSDWTINNIAVDSVSPGEAKYRIKVEARNDVGRCNETAKEIEIVAGEGVPSLAPRNLSILKVLDNKTVVVFFEPVSKKSVNGEFRGYKLENWVTESGYKNRRVRIIPGNHTVVILKVLKPSRRNNLRVWAFNREHNGPPSDVLTFSTIK